MKDNKGMSMIILIVTIIVILIFLGFSYRVGSRYISESKDTENNALVSILSDAITRRQNDIYVGTIEADYPGYNITNSDYTTIANKKNIAGEVYAPGLWFFIDAKEAKKLGIVEGNNFFTPDFLNYDSSKDSKKYIAIVNYNTGKVVLMEMKELDKIITISNYADGEIGI